MKERRIDFDWTSSSSSEPFVKIIIQPRLSLVDLQYIRNEGKALIFKGHPIKKKKRVTAFTWIFQNFIFSININLCFLPFLFNSF